MLCISKHFCIFMALNINSPKPNVMKNSILMLIAAGEITYSEPVLLPDTTLKMKEMKNPPVIHVEQHPGASMLKLKPNPANDFVIVEWKLPETSGKPWLYISSVKGQLIDKIKLNGVKNEKVLSTVNWKPGTYLLSIVSEGIQYDSRKLNIIK